MLWTNGSARLGPSWTYTSWVIMRNHKLQTCANRIASRITTTITVIWNAIDVHACSVSLWVLGRNHEKTWEKHAQLRSCNNICKSLCTIMTTTHCIVWRPCEGAGSQVVRPNAARTWRTAESWNEGNESLTRCTIMTTTHCIAWRPRWVAALAQWVAAAAMSKRQNMNHALIGCSVSLSMLPSDNIVSAELQSENNMSNVRLKQNVHHDMWKGGLLQGAELDDDVVLLQ